MQFLQRLYKEILTREQIVEESERELRQAIKDWSDKDALYRKAKARIVLLSKATSADKRNAEIDNDKTVCDLRTDAHLAKEVMKAMFAINKSKGARLSAWQTFNRTYQEYMRHSGDASDQMLDDEFFDDDQQSEDDE